MAENASESTPLLEPAFLRRLERLAIAAKRVHLGATKGERRSKRKGSSIEFADYRDYVQGDDLRHVDWNIVGRLDALYLKLFQEHEALTLHLLVDASRSMTFGTPHKIDFARRLAAAIGYIGLCGYDRVCAEALGDSPQRMAPIVGKASARKLFRFLGTFTGDGGTHLDEACRMYTVRNRSKGVALIISDFYDEAGFEGPLKRLLVSGSDVYVIHVLAPEELEPELSGDLKLVDSETNAFTEISVSHALLRQYNQNRDAFVERIRSYCLARGSAYFLVSSATPIETLTLDILRKGRMLK